jgi:hypothetical protein
MDGPTGVLGAAGERAGCTVAKVVALLKRHDLAHDINNDVVAGRAPHEVAHGRSPHTFARVVQHLLTVERIHVDALDAAETFGLADLATQDVERSLPNLAVWVIERLDDREPGWVVDDRVIEHPQTAVADSPRRMVHATEERRLGILSSRPQRLDRVVFAFDLLELQDEVVIGRVHR